MEEQLAGGGGLLEAGLNDRAERLYSFDSRTCYVFPNPNKGTMKLRLETPFSDDVEIIIYDINGSKVHQEIVEEPLKGISYREICMPENTKNGVYMVKISQNGKVITKKTAVLN